MTKPETKVIAEFSILPVGVESTSLGSWVAIALRAISEVDGLEYELTPMGTILQARSLETILSAVKSANEALFSHGARRTLSTLRIDDRRDKARTMKEKVRSVEERFRDKGGD